jgi:hypothetical protein
MTFSGMRVTQVRYAKLTYPSGQLPCPLYG